jgi:hypothetical protein
MLIFHVRVKCGVRQVGLFAEGAFVVAALYIIFGPALLFRFRGAVLLGALLGHAILRLVSDFLRDLLVIQILVRLVHGRVCRSLINF